MLSKLLRWARIIGPGENGKQFFTQQLEYNGKVADALVVYPYGHHANAPGDSLAVMMAINGDAENRAALPWDSKRRPTLEEGEVAFYHPTTGSTLIWKASGDLDIIPLKPDDGGAANINITCLNANVTAEESVNITSPETTIDGNLTVTGETALSDTVTSNGVDISDTHLHGQPNTTANALVQGNTLVPLP